MCVLQRSWKRRRRTQQRQIYQKNRNTSSATESSSSPGSMRVYLRHTSGTLHRCLIICRQYPWTLAHPAMNRQIKPVHFLCLYLHAACSLPLSALGASAVLHYWMRLKLFFHTLTKRWVSESKHWFVICYWALFAAEFSWCALWGPTWWQVFCHNKTNENPQI